MPDAQKQSFTDIVADFFQDNGGNYSATRLAFLVWALGVLAVWSFVSLRAQVLQPLSSDIATVLGVLMTGKVVQKFAENSPNNSAAGGGPGGPPPPPPPQLASNSCAGAGAAIAAQPVLPAAL